MKECLDELSNRAYPKLFVYWSFLFCLVFFMLGGGVFLLLLAVSFFIGFIFCLFVGLSFLTSENVHYHM